MTVMHILGITFVAGLIFLYEWPKLQADQKKEKAAFITLTLIGWGAAIFYLLFPHTPGPLQLIDNVFHPLSTFLE